MQVFAVVPSAVPPDVGKTAEMQKAHPVRWPDGLPVFSLDGDVADGASSPGTAMPTASAPGDRDNVPDLALVASETPPGQSRSPSGDAALVAMPNKRRGGSRLDASFLAPGAGSAVPRMGDAQRVSLPDSSRDGAVFRTNAMPGPLSRTAAHLPALGVSGTASMGGAPMMSAEVGASADLPVRPSPGPSSLVRPATEGGAPDPAAPAIDLRAGPEPLPRQDPKDRMPVPRPAAGGESDQVEARQGLAPDPPSRRPRGSPVADTTPPISPIGQGRSFIPPQSSPVTVPLPWSTTRPTADAAGPVPSAQTPSQPVGGDFVRVEWKPRREGESSGKRQPAPAARVPDRSQAPRQEPAKVAAMAQAASSSPPTPAQGLQAGGLTGVPPATAGEAEAVTPASLPPIAAADRAAPRRPDTSAAPRVPEIFAPNAGDGPLPSDRPARTSPQPAAAIPAPGASAAASVPSIAPAAQSQARSSPALSEISVPPILTPEGEALTVHIDEAPGLVAARQSPEIDSPRRTVDNEVRSHQIARAAAAQIADALKALPEGSIDVRLSPEELGRVRLSLVPGEAGLSVTIVAERAETLELLRRHVDLLGDDLRDAGYEGLSFSFGRENGRDAAPDASDRTPDTASGGAPPPDRPRSHTALPMISAVGLDIRL